MVQWSPSDDHISCIRGEKKTICNKFPAESPVTAIAWPSQRHNELVFGGQDGKIRCGNLKSNKFSVRG